MKTSIYTILGIIGIVLVVVVGMALTSVTDVIPNSNGSGAAEGIDAYMPTESSIWEYSNDETYKKVMVTEQVYTSDKFTHIIVKGEEDDESIKSFRKDYSFEYTYKIEADQITRTLEGDVLNDGFKEVVLLKTPIKENTKWQDHWTDLNGVTYSVNSVIKSVQEDGRLVVESTDRGGQFQVERTLEIGKGVTAFKIIEKYDDIEFETGYHLLQIDPFDYEGFDNYMALLGNEKIGTMIDTIEESSDLDSGSEEDVNSSATAVKNESQTQEDTEALIQEDDEIDEEERLAIEASVKLFNEKWISFINDGDMSIMDTITPNASVETIIEAYMDKEMTQEFLTMEIKRIVVRGNIANAYVYEEIERTMDGQTEVLLYNWIYEIDKIDGSWLVEGYIENKNP